jgi:hypothetical protein
LKIFLIIDNEVHYRKYSIYWHGKGQISDCLNRLLHEALGCAPAIIMMILFCKAKIFPLLEKLPPKIIPYFTTE